MIKNYKDKKPYFLKKEDDREYRIPVVTYAKD